MLKCSNFVRKLIMPLSYVTQVCNDNNFSIKTVETKYY